MLLMVKKGTRGGTCHAIHRYVKANKNHHIFWDFNNLYGWAMSQNSVDSFK